MIILKRTGGWGEEDSTLEIDTDGSFSFRKFIQDRLLFESKGIIESSKFDELIKLVTKIDLDLLEEDYSPEIIGYDIYDYHLTILKDEKKKIITTKTEGTHPQDIKNLIEFLEILMTEIPIQKKG